MVAQSVANGNVAGGRAVADEIARWRKGIGLSRYAQAFAENDIDFDILSRLSDEILKELDRLLEDRVRLQAANKACDNGANRAKVILP